MTKWNVLMSENLELKHMYYVSITSGIEEGVSSVTKTRMFYFFQDLDFFSSTLKKSKWFTSVTEMSVVFHWLKGALHFGNWINIRV